MSAAALSAAVDSRKPIEDRTPLTGGTNYAKPAQLQRPPLFGREREGGASLREAASLAYPQYPFLSSEEGPGEGFLFREAASPGVPLFLQYRRA